MPNTEIVKRVNVIGAALIEVSAEPHVQAGDLYHEVVKQQEVLTVIARCALHPLGDEVRGELNKILDEIEDFTVNYLGEE